MIDLVAARDIDIAIKGTAGIITLGRVRALNALTHAMREDLAAAFPRFARDTQVYAVVIRSTSPKAFGAGSDVREIINWAREDLNKARRALAGEYRLNWQIECFSKPCVSLIDGMVMGGGVGISLYGTHRVAGEGYRFAMPETMIGLFPDVGAAHVLARMPNEIGVYLGLTGRSIGRADAFNLGLVTHCISAKLFEEVIAGLENTQPVDPLLDDRHADPGQGELRKYADTIAKCFSQATPGAILACLASVTGPDAEWAQAVAVDLAARSPTSLAITLRHIRQAKKLDLRETLIVDYRLGCRCLEGHDFFEGVRAVLIDKENKPVWRPAAVLDVGEETIESYFASLGETELSLPTRSQMQEARA